MVKLGDTLHTEWLDLTVAKGVEKFFPPTELEQYSNAKQVQGTMRERVTIVSAIGSGVVLLGFLWSIYLVVGAWRRRDLTVVGLIAIIWIGVLANAFATGALSKPHYRYQTRIAWLLVLPPILLFSKVRQRETIPA